MEVKIDGLAMAKRLLGQLNADVVQHIPFATALALTRTAQRIQKAEYSVMRQRFDRPTPYTMNSLYLKPATKSKLVAVVKVKDEAYKGVPASKFLRPEMEGGGRNQKRSEKLLGKFGSPYITPAQGVPLDGYGNVQNGYMTKVLSALQAFGNQGWMMNRTQSKRSQKKAKAFDIFIAHEDGLKGIFERRMMAHGTGLRPLFWFHDDAPRYKIAVPFDKIATNVHNAHIQREYKDALIYALKTAR